MRHSIEHMEIAAKEATEKHRGDGLAPLLTDACIEIRRLTAELEAATQAPEDPPAQPGVGEGASLPPLDPPLTTNPPEPNPPFTDHSGFGNFDPKALVDPEAVTEPGGPGVEQPPETLNNPMAPKDPELDDGPELPDDVPTGQGAGPDLGKDNNADA